MVSLFDCDRCEACLPGYVLNALELEETAATVWHLSTCARCQNSLAAFETVVDHLGENVEVRPPPPELRRRLIAAVAEELVPAAASLRRLPLRGWWAWSSRWAPVLTGASALLFLSAVWWGWQGWQAMSHARDRWWQVAHQLELQRQALLLLTTLDSRQALLRGGEGRARGVLLLQATASEAVLVVDYLPPLNVDRVYQLWLIRDGTRDNGGIFRVNEQGFGVLVIHAPYPMATYQATGITEEPAGGSPGPTSPRLIGGRLGTAG
jgi:hypothetical protein